MLDTSYRIEFGKWIGEASHVGVGWICTNELVKNGSIDVLKEILISAKPEQKLYAFLALRKLMMTDAWKSDKYLENLLHEISQDSTTVILYRNVCLGYSLRFNSEIGDEANFGDLRASDIFTYGFEPPSFVDGGIDVNSYLSDRLKYPYGFEIPRDTGTITLSFTIEPTGSVSNIEWINTYDGMKIGNQESVSWHCLDEAIRALQTTSGMWKSGTIATYPVRTENYVEIRFGID